MPPADIVPRTQQPSQTAATAARHYVSPLDAHYREAVANNPWKSDAKPDAICSQNPTPQVPAGIGKDSQFGV